MLSNYLKKENSASTFLIHDEGKCMSRELLAKWVDSSRLQLEGLLGQRVAIRSSSSLDLILLLLLCDGWVESLLILPDDLTEDNIAKTYQIEAKVNGIISLGSNLAKDLEVPRIEWVNSKLDTEWNGSTTWIIATSGTTKNPKLVEHTLQSLSNSIKLDSNKGNDITWGLLYDVSRFAGLQVFLQSLMGGSSLLIDDKHEDVEQRISYFAEHKCNALSATPTLWRKILMSHSASKMHLRLITLGGEIANQMVLNALALAFPSARITHIYASTEIGVGFAVADRIEGFPVAWLKAPPQGIELLISNRSTLKIRRGKLTQKYLSESLKLADDDGFIDTGDLVEICNDRVLFRGRENGAINVGGNKVQPEEVERVIGVVPGVAIVKISGIVNSIMGSLVEANIVLENGFDPKEVREAVAEKCREQLEPFKRPALVKIVDDMNTNRSGKIIRSR